MTRGSPPPIPAPMLRLAQLDDAEVEQAVLAALRDRVPDTWHETIDHLAVEHSRIVSGVAAHLGPKLDASTLRATRADLAPIDRVLWMLTARGYGLPVLRTQDRGPEIEAFRILQAGARMLRAEPASPWSAEYLAGLKSAGVPESAVTHLSDAIACLRHGLLRPAIVMLGMAYEDVAIHVLKATSGYQERDSHSARVGKLRRKLESKANTDAKAAGGPPNDHTRYTLALSHAYAVGDRRNAGAHPDSPAPTFAEIESELRVAPIKLREIMALKSKLRDP